MKNYNIYLPEEKDFCVPACIQAILNFENIQISQKTISKNLSSAEKGFKVHDRKIKQFFYDLGFDYDCYWWNETPLNEPEIVLKDMDNNHGLIGIKYHSYILGKFKDPLVKIIDPNDKKVKVKDYYSLIREMSKTEGFFGLIKRLY